MINFADDFNRANGAIGANWIQAGGDASIVSNALYMSSGTVRPNGYSSSGSQRIRVSMLPNSDNRYPFCPYFGWSGDTVELYYISMTGDSSTQTWSLRKRWANFYDEQRATAVTHIAAPGAHVFQVTLTGGDIVFSVDDTPVITYTDPAPLTSPYAGLGGAYGQGRYDWYETGDAVSRTLTVTPDPLWVGGGQQFMTATGTNTAWTPGEPGSTTITCDHGTVDLQRVNSATEAQFLYTPAEYIGTLTFTESQYGLTDTVNAVAVMPEGYGSTECRLTEQGAELINDTAAETPLTKRLFARNSTVGTAPIDATYEEVIKWLADFLIYNGWSTNPTPTGAINDIFRWIAGDHLPTMPTPEPPSQTTLKQDLAALQAAIDAIPTGLYPDLSAVVNGLAGDPFASHRSIIEAISAIPAADLSEVINKLDIIGGNYDESLTSLALLLGFIQGNNGYTLDTIVQRLDDRPTTLNMNAAFAVTNGAIGGLALEIAGLYKGLGLVEATNLADLITGIIGDLFSGLGSDLIDNFLDGITQGVAGTAQKVLVPPIWPGETDAIVGDSQALVDGMTVNGPLHGLILTIDGHPVTSYGYHFGSVTSWGRVGAVIFATDRGDYERSQTFAIDTQVLCPQQMAVAAHAIIKVNSGWSGTVRPWSYGPGVLG